MHRGNCLARFEENVHENVGQKVGSLVSTGIIGYITWLIWCAFAAPVSKPENSIQQFYVPALVNFSTNHTIDTNINFVLEFKTMDTPIDYGVLGMTLYYGPNGTSISPIGSGSLPGFYQDIHSTVYKEGTIKTNGIPWDNAIKEVHSKGSAVFKVVLSAAVNYKDSCKGCGRQKIKMGGNVMVNDLGINVEKHGTKLALLSTPVKLSRRQGPELKESNLGLANA